jgi:emfourin
MIIRVEREGGIAGIPISNEMDSKDVPSDLLRAAKKIADGKKSSSPLKSLPKGAADHYTYKISVQDGGNRSVIECNQFNIGDDLRSLVKYVEKNSKQKKTN